MDIDRARISKCDDPWALAIIDSRTNYLPDDTYSLTPMLDMINHDPTYKTSARVEESKRLMLEVSSDSILRVASTTTASVDWKDQVLNFLKGRNDNQVNIGDEIFVSYGEFDNVELLSNYGFCTVENPSNIEQFKVRSLAMGTKPTILIVDSQGLIDNIFNMMSLELLRVSLASRIELEKYEGTGKISEGNEIEMYALIAGELEEAVYDATSGVEEAKLRDDSLVSTYLQGRQRTLQSGLNDLKIKYPEIF